MTTEMIAIYNGNNTSVSKYITINAYTKYKEN